MAKYTYAPITANEYLDWEGLKEFWVNAKQYIQTENAKQNGSNIFLDDTASITIAGEITDINSKLQNLRNGVDGILAEKKVNSLYVEGDDNVSVTLESDGEGVVIDEVSGYLTGNVSIKIDSSALADRVLGLETGTIKSVTAVDAKEGGNDYVNISSSTEAGVTNITLDDTKLSQVITTINNKVVVTKVESNDGDDDLVKVVVSGDGTGDVSVSIDETKLVTQLATAGDHSNLINDASVNGSDSNTVELSVEKKEQKLEFTLNTTPLTTKLTELDGDIEGISGEIDGVKQTIQQNYGNSVHSIGGLKGDVLLSNSTEAGTISFSTNDNTISGNVVGLGNAAYDNFIECTEEQILAIIGDIPTAPNPGAGGEPATPEDIGSLFPQE